MGRRCLIKRQVCRTGERKRGNKRVEDVQRLRRTAGEKGNGSREKRVTVICKIKNPWVSVYSTEHA
jgi:hypothetical protein